MLVYLIFRPTWDYWTIGVSGMLLCQNYFRLYMFYTYQIVHTSPFKINQAENMYDITINSLLSETQLDKAGLEMW